MDKLVKLNIQYLGRLIRPSNEAYQLQFWTSPDNKNWNNAVGYTVEWDSKTQTYSASLDQAYKPLTASGSTTNNNKYQNIVDSTQSGRSFEIRVPETEKYYRVLVNCDRCCKLYPERVDGSWFVAASGSMEEF